MHAPKPPHRRCPCGRPVTAGRTTGELGRPCLCLICETRLIMASFVYPPRRRENVYGPPR